MADSKWPDSGLNPDLRQQTQTVIVSAVIETTGHARFGDGTEINLTITEKDTVLSSVGEPVEKVVFAGTKRRGVDRRTMHDLRNRYWQATNCHTPKLCGVCPTCLLLGFTGTTQDNKDIKDVNAKSRILYGTGYSIQPTGDAVVTHSRNQVDERNQTTAGSAGIHEEELIVGGVWFPTATTMCQVLGWEIGAFAHAFLENLNAGRYSAASRAQGGSRLAEAAGAPLLVVDVSVPGIFPLMAPRVPAAESEPEVCRAAFQVDAREEAKRLGLHAEEEGGKVTIKRENDPIMTRYRGRAAEKYLRDKQAEFHKFLRSFEDGGRGFSAKALAYYASIKPGRGDDGGS